MVNMITRLTYRRHIFEIVEELSDAVFWTAILLGFCVPVGILFDYRRFWVFAAFAIYPITKLFIEILRWRSELYIIECGPDSAVLRKEWGILNKRKLSDPLKIVSAYSEQPLHMRILGACRVKVRSAANSFIEGRLVPIEFYRELDKVISGHKKSVETSMDNTALGMVALVPQLVDAGLIHPMVAQNFVESTYEAWR